MEVSKLGITKNGKPRQRRERLSPLVRQIEHNVLIHIKRDVRHTGRGWNPLMLDQAWDQAVKRMLKDGILQDRADLGGIVPTEFADDMEAEQKRMLNYIKLRSGSSRKPVQLRSGGRRKALALGRLVLSGSVKFDPKSGYSPKD